MVTTIQFNGMTCFACEKVIGNKLKRLADVQQVIVSLDTQKAVVTAQKKLTLQEVQEALQGTKYTIISVV